MATFKDIIQHLRLEQKLSQEELSKHIGMSKSTVAMWETGKRIPSPDVYEQLADFFNVDMDYIYGRSNIKKKYSFDNSGVPYIYDENLTIINYYNKLNDIGKNEAEKRVKELTFIPEYKNTYEEVLNAAHERTDIEVTDEMIKHDDDIMDDENF